MDRKAWIVILLCIAGMVVNGWWMVKNPPPPPAAKPEVSAPAAAGATTSAGDAATGTAAAQPAGAGTTPSAPVAPVAPEATEEKVELTNADVAYTFTTKGGGVLQAKLLTTGDHVILNEQGKAAVGALSTAALQYADLNYRIVDMTGSRIVFEAVSPEQVLIRKEYSLTEGEGSNTHLLKFKLTLTNQGAARLARDSYYLYTGEASSLRPDEVEMPAFVWNSAGSADYYHTTSFRDGSGWFGMGGPIQTLPEKYTSHSRLRWAGVMSRFYTILISPDQDSQARIWATRFPVDHSKDEFKDHPKAGNDFAVHGGMSLAPVELEPGASKTFDMRIYMGAKIFHDLKKVDNADIASDLPNRQFSLVMFYGIFSWISRILVGGLRTFHDWTGNWGVAIIFLTICVRTVLWPVQARSNRTMKRMGLLSPKLKELQEKHKDDPQRLNSEMMKMYREYGVNPVGGCLPLLIQIPIFFGFYSVLRYAAELRGQDFLWVTDLSMPDTITTLSFLGYNLPLNPLPLLMGVTMFLQMKLTPQPATADKMQQRIFMFMPFIFLWFCYNFASALALYWTAQNIYSIFQAQITRIWQKDPVLEKVAVAATPDSGSSGKGKKKPSSPRPGGGGSNSTRKK